MALFVDLDGTGKRSELQQKLNAELREKAEKKASVEADPVDNVKDSKFIEGSKEANEKAWIWIIAVVLIVAIASGIAIWFALSR